MKFFGKDKMCARQGDVMFLRVNEMVGKTKQIEPTEGKFVLAHSETGHNHVLEAKPNVKVFGTDNPMISYLQIVEAQEATENFIEHLRSFDTHEPIAFSEGLYRVINQRESAPEGWKLASD